ncbi:FIG00907047: phosphodiesterase/nucleotide pyrophosphatase [hydrothermal vent metagenome]|uniref:FIG00907047: phosphodiesterase/nucleotide pyrophosphatase n=1 Tax=hydrothermal vent metagenome TaxID=652676 RepID=A0A3B1DLK5_9ZZZZ
MEINSTMKPYVVLLSLPGLRHADLAHMPRLSQLAASSVPLAASFPAVTCPVQATLTTGVTPHEHGVIANGFFWREKNDVEMWTAWNEAIEVPQIWDKLHAHDASITSAVWFPLLSKGCGADFICTPAPIHNPDGSESLWCYTKPTEMYGELRDTLGHFPLMNFWGPLSNIKSTAWIADSAIHAAQKHQPQFSYLYLPHLDYAAQKFGPESEQATAALVEVDEIIGRLIDGYAAAGMDDILWLVASEYVITPVDGVCYPNRILREAGLLSLREEEGLEYLEPGNSKAWAMVDHQLAHLFVADKNDIEATANLFRNHPDIAEVLVGEELAKYQMDHPRSGEILLISKPEKWFAYYWWTDDSKAPSFARTVDIHRKPGYDPVEMFINMPEKETPLDATLVKGSHGYPAETPERRGVLISSNATILPKTELGYLKDIDIAGIVLHYFGVD